jgi:transcriptional regulator of acetoin/glycerol metabolism
MAKKDASEGSSQGSIRGVGEVELWAALVQAEGRVLAAAKILGVPRSSVQTALKCWAKHLAADAKRLRENAGHGGGHPVTHRIDESRFLAVWKRLEGNIKACAKELNVDRYVVRRLAAQYGAPGAGPARALRKLPARKPRD